MRCINGKCTTTTTICIINQPCHTVRSNSTNADDNNNNNSTDDDNDVITTIPISRRGINPVGAVSIDKFERSACT